MQKKKGISLIVLVITIIVMIILASTVIISLTGNSVIDRANEAVKKTDLANVQQLASTLWAEAYLDGAREEEDFEAAITKGLTGYDTTSYKIIVTTEGVEVKLLSEMWIKKGFTVVKGDQVLEIGDIVHYDETASGTKSVSVDTQWQVLGADEAGNLLLLSTGNVVDLHILGDETSGENIGESQKDWINGAEELDGLCEPYGYGKKVVGKARSVTVEDVDSVTGYDKTTFGKGEVYQYGNEVTYSYNNKTTKPAYTSKVVSSELTIEHSKGFYYYNGKEFKVANDLTSKDTGTITTLKSNFYHYDASGLTTISAEENKKAYEMIFRNGYTYYWLASSYADTMTGYVDFGMYYVDRSVVTGYLLWSSDGYSSYNLWHDLAVRAVVTLQSDITFTGDSTNGWSY